MSKLLSSCIATAILLTACSDNPTPAVIERKDSVFYGRDGARNLDKSSSSAVKHGEVVGSEISEKPLTTSTLEQDVYQQEDSPEKPVTAAKDEEEPFDLTELDQPAEIPAASGHYKTAHPLNNPKFMWPADGPVIAHFGKTAHGINEGVTIDIPTGTPVKAAADGEVLFVGQDKMYGQLIIVKHPNDIFTAYAHNSKLSVNKGQHISKGSVIAHSGSSGETSSPQLYFSVRKGATTIDPEKSL